MAITITDDQIRRIAQGIQEELTDPDTGELYSFERVVGAAENWLLRTAYEIERSPWWHANRSEVPGQALPSFEMDLQCAYFGWSQCRNQPELGSVFCKDHQAREDES